MIIVKIEVPHQITQVMTPKMVMGNYVECDPRVQLLQQDKLRGLCTVEVKSDIDWEEETTNILIKARYFSKEQEMLTMLSL
jgi:hypothetical protein